MARLTKIRKEVRLHGLDIATLAGTYEAARAVVRLLPAHTLSTVDQLNAHIKKSMRKRELMVELFRAIEHLEQHTRVLGATTLVKPADHPLVIRQTLPKDVPEEE